MAPVVVDSAPPLAYAGAMNIEIGQAVTIPSFTPYPLFGRVQALDESGVHVTDVQCGDPRCPSEHAHSPQVWPLASVEGSRAYQPRAPWEWGRKTSPNTPIA